MKFQVKYDANYGCKVILKEQLELLSIPYEINGFGMVNITKPLIS